MFFHLARYIIYLKRQEIEIFDTKTKRFTLPLAETIVKHLDILDQNEYQTVLSSTFDSLPIKNTSLAIILAPDVLFHTKLTGANPSELQTFLKTVPFDGENVVFTSFHTKTESSVFATNSLLYTIIQQVALQHHVTLVTVIPALIIPELMSPTAVDAKLLHKSLRRTYKKNGNFLRGSKIFDAETPSLVKPDNSPEEKAPKTSKFKIFVLFPVSIILLIASFSYAAYSMGLFTFPTTKKVTPPPVSSQTKKSDPVSPPKEVTPAAEIFAKDSLTIKILNGSEVSGHAGTVKDLLLKSGFDNIATGNATTSATTTTIIFSPRVSEEDQKELEQIVSITSESTKSISSKAEETDILIITGTLKDEN